MRIVLTRLWRKRTEIFLGGGGTGCPLRVFLGVTQHLSFGRMLGWVVAGFWFRRTTCSLEGEFAYV